MPSVGSSGFLFQLGHSSSALLPQGALLLMKSQCADIFVPSTMASPSTHDSAAVQREYGGRLRVARSMLMVSTQS